MFFDWWTEPIFCKPLPYYYATVVHANLIKRRMYAPSSSILFILPDDYRPNFGNLLLHSK